MEALAERLMAIRAEFPTTARLVDEVHRLRREVDELLAELDGRDEEARERWIAKTLAETGIKAMEFRGGMSMELEPAREMVAHWVGAARGMLGDAPNYSETPIEMHVKVAESPETFAFTLQRVGKLTPHQARQRAERERDEARAACRSAAALLRSTADRLDSPQRPDPLLLNMAARDLDQTAGPEPRPQMTAEDVRGGFWPDMTGGRCSLCHLATLRGYDPEPDCPDCNTTTKETRS
jgi:hypothetical protein